MYNRLVNNLKNHAILSPNQYGFRENLSTENVICTLLNATLTALNHKLKVEGLSCDVEKAFYCVNHDILYRYWKYMESLVYIRIFTISIIVCIKEYESFHH
jgi:hypothetical protein